jgi:carbon-monoxide dehydrogenase large subunit
MRPTFRPTGRLRSNFVAARLAETEHHVQTAGNPENVGLDSDGVKVREMVSAREGEVPATRFGIGQPVTRKEDPRFLTGRGRFVADIDLARQAHAVFLFSPHAHARIRTIDTAAAIRAPGVHAVLTGQDWAADGLGTLDPEVMPEDMGGPKGHRTKRPPLAIDRVRYVGERVAVVIAATEALARDAAEMIAVDYEVLPAVVRAEDAVRPDAPLVHDSIPGNIAVTLRMGNADAVEPAFARAQHVARLSLVNNRITAVTMEPRGCIAEYDAGTGRYTLTTSTQNVTACARPSPIRSCMCRRAASGSSLAMSAAASA